MRRPISIRTIFLTFSIAANIFLGFNHFRRPAGTTAPHVSPDNIESTLRSGGGLAAETVQPQLAGLSCDWSDIDSPDPYELVRRLRRLEFPNCVVEQILLGRLREVTTQVVFEP